MKEVLLKDDSDNIREKDIRDLIIFIKNTDLKQISDPNYIASRYVENNIFYPLKGNLNYKYYYEQILIETGSVEFEHLY